MFKKIVKFIFAHKIVSSVAIVVLVFSGWFVFSSISKQQVDSKYVVSSVTKGVLISSVSGTGQVATSNEATINAKVSGEITYVGVTVGQEVGDGKLLLKIDSTDAEQAIKDAQSSYDLAMLSLEELKAPADELTILQAENSLINAQQSKEDAESNLKKAYSDGFTSVSNAFLDLPNVTSGLNSLLFGTAFNDYQSNMNYYAGVVMKYDSNAQQYRNDVNDKYQKAKTAYDQNFIDYKNSNRNIDSISMESLINETYDTALFISDAVKSANDLIQFYKDKLTDQNITSNSLADTHLTLLSGYMSKINSILSNLLSIQQTINNNKKSYESTDRTIIEKQISLDKIRAGATELNIKSQELSVNQKYNSLLSAQKNLNNYYITAPFSGTVAKINVSKGDSVSSGASLATFISKGKIVSVSLNEVDISKIIVGNAATLTFDALEDVSLTGKVTQVDAIGTVSSGVVNYNVEISFEDDASLVKPGMSASVNIITEVKTGALLVPNSAIKSINNSYYVEVPVTTIDENLLDVSKGVSLIDAPINKTVEIGSANDYFTEILTGLSEGDQVISSILSGVSNSTKASTSTTSNTTRSNGANMMMQGLGGPPN
ncbi:MAG: efflux RND transporter periplasmic adaptor subunit [Candidatus Paceibacterota bacterium]|jgi:HlyD family secretion protein